MDSLKEIEVCAQTELLWSPIFLFCLVCIVLYNSTDVLNTGNQFATATPGKKHCTKIHHSMILGLVFIGLIKVRSIHSAQKMECILYDCARKNQGHRKLSLQSRIKKILFASQKNKLQLHF